MVGAVEQVVEVLVGSGVGKDASGESAAAAGHAEVSSSKGFEVVVVESVGVVGGAGGVGGPGGVFEFCEPVVDFIEAWEDLFGSGSGCVGP